MWVGDAHRVGFTWAVYAEQVEVERLEQRLEGKCDPFYLSPYTAVFYLSRTIQPLHYSPKVWHAQIGKISASEILTKPVNARTPSMLLSS